ncbi:DNA replication regulator sld2 [Penicillium chermesinum]|nr:DNA replication regulator sld2 [Penicillium chermesinum]
MFKSLLSLGRSTNYFVPKVDPKVKVETSLPLYGQIKEFHSHILVATGRTDWKEKVEHEKGTLMEALNQPSAKSKHGRYMVSASNIQPPDYSGTDDPSKPTTVLILPSFTFIDSVSQADVPDLIHRFVDSPVTEKSGIGPVTPTTPLIKRELERHLRPLGLDRDADDSRPGGAGIFFVSHVGGHKFSANVLIYRKKDQQMIWLARVRPEHCEGIVKYTLLQGKVVHPEDQLRGGFDRCRGVTSCRILATMDHQNSSEAAAQAVALRGELKVWEKQFLSDHQRKAGRDDIKQNRDIAAKYKEYGRLKNLEAALMRREKRAQDPEANSKKRKHTSSNGPDSNGPDREGATPRKSAKGIFATPSNPRTKLQPWDVDPYDSPSTFRRLFSPSTHRQNLPAPSPLKAAIGPTPQRDGKALGLFDMLSESGGSAPTPSAKKQGETLAAGFRTPSKPKTKIITAIPEEEEEEVSSKLSRTPASSTKQFYLANLFATPTTMRYAAMVEAEDEKETQVILPTQTAPTKHNAQIRLERRHSSDAPILAASTICWARAFASGAGSARDGRGEMEADLDMLREIEAEQEAANFQVPESQSFEHGKPYKKKGQKRTTRRVIMRPVLTKPKPAEPAAPVVDDSSDDELAAVPETQVQEVPPEVEEEGKPLKKIAMMLQIDDDPEYDEEPRPARSKSFSERIKEAVGMSKLKPKETPAPKAEPVPVKEEKQPRPKKYNPQAHANYRSLKIHHKRGSGGGRFPSKIRLS